MMQIVQILKQYYLYFHRVKILTLFINNVVMYLNSISFLQIITLFFKSLFETFLNILK